MSWLINDLGHLSVVAGWHMDDPERHTGRFFTREGLRAYFV